MNINKIWFAVPNDLVGGWSVMNCNQAPSKADFTAGEREVAGFVNEEDAKHMVILHNSWLMGPR